MALILIRIRKSSTFFYTLSVFYSPDWLYTSLFMERVKGIEHSYPAWKAGALADVLHPHRGKVFFLPVKNTKQSTEEIGIKRELLMLVALWSRRPDSNRYGCDSEGF